MMKKSFKILLIIGLMIMFKANTKVVHAENDLGVSETFINLIDDCMKNSDTLVLEKGGIDVTDSVKSTIIALYKQNKYEDIKKLLDNNLYELSYIDKGNCNDSIQTRAMVSDTFTKRVPRSKTVTSNGQTAKATWATIVRCSYTWNYNTQKIGTINPTTITLESQFVSPDTEYANLENVYTPLGQKSADGFSFTISTKFTLKARCTGYPFTMMNFGTYTDTFSVAPTSA